MATCNAYPKFEANQVLTAAQLNRVVEYLKEQDLLTRRKLIGIGPYCGLEVGHTSGAAPTIRISAGCGITSAGDMVVLPFSEATRFRSYFDPVDYPLFRNGAAQVNLWELRTAAETTVDDGSQPLSAAFLRNKIVLLYLECREIDLKTCTGDDCDEEGIRVEACVKKLAVDIAEADIIIQNARDAAPQGNDAFLAKYQLPRLRPGRSFDLLKLGARITADDLVKYYQGLTEPILDDLSQAYERSYETYLALLGGDFSQNPFEAVRLRKVLDQVMRTNPRHYQYVYDFVKDLVDAYDEFRLTAFDFGAECCPDPAHFPKHLMLGPVIADADCAPSAYRQHFIPAPLFNRQERLRNQCRLLFKKMALLVNSFKVPPYRRGAIRITPSVGPSRPLSRRALPYYYAGPEKLHRSWNPELNRICKADHLLSYHAARYAPRQLAFVHDPLEFEWDDFSFLRVEGHIGGKYADVSAEIEALIRRYNLPVQLVGLKLDARKGIILPDIRIFEDFRSRLNLAAAVLGLKHSEVDVLLDSDRLASKIGINATIKPELVKSLKTATAISPTATFTAPLKPDGPSVTFDPAQPFGPVLPPPVFRPPLFQPPVIPRPLPPEKPESEDPPCRYQDLEAIYAALRGELICLLEKETEFFGNLKFEDKQKTYTEGVTGFTGSIIDLKGKPLPNAEVTILDSRFKNAVAKGTTAADGTFDFKDLQPGKYYVDVRYGDLEISKDLVDVQDKQTLGINYRFEASAPKETFAIQSTAGASNQTTFGPTAGVKMAAATEGFSAIKSSPSASTIKTAAAAPVSKASPTLGESSSILGYTRSGAPLTTLGISKAAVLDKGLSKPTTRNSIGEFYKELDKSVLKEDTLNFSYHYFARYPFADRIKIPEVFAKQIKSPLTLLRTFDQLDKTLPDTLVAFDYSVFEFRYRAMVSAAEDYREQVIKDLGELSLELRGNEDEILIHLDHLLAACSLEKFEALFEIYTVRKTKLDNLIRFAAFIQEHLGAEHLAGVFKGGTLIIVYDTRGIVVADFCLPYICCSECPPVTVGAPLPVIFKLPRSEFCKSDPNRYKVITNVPGETVKGPGIEVDETTGDSYFRPAADDVPLGTVRWTYVVAHRTYTFEARLIEADAGFSHVVTVDEVDPTRAAVRFSANTTDADTYSWDFGDESEPSTEANPTHNYTLSDTEQTVEVTLTIERNICRASHPETIILPAAALEPLEINIDTTSFCSDDPNRHSLSVSPADPAGNVISSHGGIIAEDGAFFFVPDAADIDIGPVELSYVIGGRSASLTVNLLNPQADFIVGDPQERSPGTYEVAFTNTSTNAGTFAWVFGDGQTSSESDPVMTFSEVSAGQQISAVLTASVDGQCPSTSEGLVRIPVPTELTITLEKSRFCKREDEDYPITVDPIDPGGLVTGEGVESRETGFFFNPSQTTTAIGSITLTYTIGDSSADTTVQLLHPTAKFTFTEPRKVSSGIYKVQFTNTSVNANTFAWKFGDGQTSSAVSPLISYTDVAPGQTLPVTLTASVNEDCGHVRRRSVTIPLDLSISLDEKTFCKRDESRHNIDVQPVDPAGVVTGPGVAKVEDRFVFVPSDGAVTVGTNVLTYRLGIRRTSTTVTVADPRAAFAAQFSRPDQSTYMVRFSNKSTDASTFKWSILPPRMAMPVISTDREPTLKLPDTRPGDPLSVSLVASLNGRCPDQADETLKLPDIPPETVPPPAEIDDLVTVIDRDLVRLQKMPADPLFEVTFKTTSDEVFAGMLELYKRLKGDLADPAVLERYQQGIHNDELAERFDAPIRGSMRMIQLSQGAAAAEQRQYVYIVIRMLTELLARLTAFQDKDLDSGSALFGTLSIIVEIYSFLLELGLKLDTDGSLAQALADVRVDAQDQPNVLEALKKLSELIG